MHDKSKELSVAIEAALEAGKIAEKYFETEISQITKEDTSIVTLADKESEEKIKEIIFKNFPDHAIFGEETGMNGTHADNIWQVDPIDGTTNFANGIPIFAVSIALVVKGQVKVGVVYNPATQSLFYAEQGQGAYFNDRKMIVSKNAASGAIVTHAVSRKEEERKMAREITYALPNRVKSVRVLGSNALELAFVARGSTEAIIEIGLSPYDFAAGVLLVEEAGGKITKFDGSEWNFPDNYFIASNGVFHDILVEEVTKQKEKLGL